MVRDLEDPLMLKRWVVPAVCLVCFPWFGWSQQILGATHELFWRMGSSPRIPILIGSFIRPRNIPPIRS